MAWAARRFSSSPNRLTLDNPGLISVLRQSIVPRLVAEAPQPSAEALAADPLLSRFTLIFDREGYSPDFFAELRAQRITILTYHKYPGDKWPAAEFARYSVRLHNGEIVEQELGERGTRLLIACGCAKSGGLTPAVHRLRS
jgi:hypothetical protein